MPEQTVGHLLREVPSWLGVAGGPAAAAAAPEAAILALRDAAVIALGIRLMRRAGELAALTVDDIRPLPDGSLGVLIQRSKTDQLGAGLLLPLELIDGPLCPVTLLRRWLAVRFVLARRGAGVDSLFVTVTGTPLSRSAISSLVQRAAAASGLEGRFSGHSLRIGGATAAARAGASMATVKSIGGWSSDAVRRYIRPFTGGLSALMGFAAG